MSVDNYLAVPTLNLGGTDGATLADEYGKALDALDAAILALRAVTVHGRDYQDGSNSFLTAQREHHARLDQLRDVQVELGTIYYNVSTQLSAREGSR